MQKHDCIFCDIVAKHAPSTIVYEDEHILAFKDIYPVAQTHILVIPKKHISSMLEVTKDDFDLMAKLMLGVKDLAEKAGLDGYKTIINTGESGGQVVFHLHLHLIANKTTHLS